jgi:hypothetical protein
MTPPGRTAAPGDRARPAERRRGPGPRLVSSIRASIAGRYLGPAAGERFAEERRSKPGVLLRLAADEPRVWSLSAILPSDV